MTQNKNSKNTDWGKIIIIIVIIIALISFYNNWRENKVDNIMNDKNYREEMNINTREEAEDNLDDMIDSQNWFEKFKWTKNENYFYAITLLSININ